MGSGPRKPSSPAQGMEEESVSLGAQNEVACVSRGLCSMALGLSVIIRKTGTVLASKKGLSWGSNGGGACSAASPVPPPVCPVHPSGSTPVPTPCLLVGCPSPVRAQTDLSPLQHLPLVQHFHGKNLPAVPLPHHGDLRPQGAPGSALPRRKPPLPTDPMPCAHLPEGPSADHLQDLEVISLQPQLSYLCYEGAG